MFGAAGARAIGIAQAGVTWARRIRLDLFRLSAASRLASPSRLSEAGILTPHAEPTFRTVRSSVPTAVLALWRLFFGKLFEIEIVIILHNDIAPNLNKIMRVSYSFSRYSLIHYTVRVSASCTLGLRAGMRPLGRKPRN